METETKKNECGNDIFFLKRVHRLGKDAGNVGCDVSMLKTFIFFVLFSIFLVYMVENTHRIAFLSLSVLLESTLIGREFLSPKGNQHQQIREEKNNKNGTTSRPLSL
jgi:hypothetical protein